MAENRFDVIVVGAGPGGASCAALLAKKGSRVLLLDQNAKAGGKALTVAKRGYAHELWPVAGSPVFNGRFAELQDILGLAHGHATAALGGRYYYLNHSGECRTIDIPTSDPAGLDPAQFAALMQWLEISEADAQKIIAMEMQKAALSEEALSALDDISYHDYLQQFDLPRAYHSLCGAMSNVFFVEPIDQAAASEYIRVTRDMAANGGGYYSLGGYGRIFERCTEAFIGLGGVAQFKTRVNKILVKDGKVSGVATDQGEYFAPVVISNAGIQPTVLKLVGESHFPAAYVDRVKKLVPSLALMGTRYFMDTKLLKEAASIVFSDESYWNTERSLRAKTGEVPDDLMIFAVVPSNFDPSLAPEGKQCILASTVCLPDPEMNNSQTYWDKLDAMMERVWPGFLSHVESKEHYGAREVSDLTRSQVLPGIGGECIGLGQIVGQCGKHKPSPVSPLPGLYYVGCDAGGVGIGTGQGVDSAFKVAAMVHTSVSE